MSKHKKPHLAECVLLCLAPHHVIFSIKMLLGTSLVVQWMGICLPMSIRDPDLILGPGKTPYAVEELSPCATTTEPTCFNY